jgi:hypothetical protein
MSIGIYFGAGFTLRQYCRPGAEEELHTYIRWSEVAVGVDAARDASAHNEPREDPT